MTKSEQQFFALFRSGLWNSPIDETLFVNEIDWETILRIAQMQTVTGILFDGVNNLPSALQPPALVMRKLYQTVIRIEQSHELLNRRIAEIVPKLEAEGIRPILLKGQGVAQNYPNPLRRQCGDIDLYVGQEDCERAMQIVIGLGAEAENKTKQKSPKHENFYIDDISLELHFLVEKLRNSTYDKRFQPWIKQSFEEELRRWNINGGEVSLPPIQFDALYIFNHAFHHFISGGVGLRQLCDWTMYLHTFNDLIDRDELLRNLKDFGILKAWQIFGCISVDEIGLSKEEIPFYTPRYKKQSRKILRKILQVGNFGFYTPQGKRPKGYLAGKLHSLYSKQKWIFSLFSVFPKDTFTIYISYWSTGINNIRKGV